MTTTLTALPLVAVVGRPNVGKSTLVNRLVGRRAAIVEERPGVTRDRKELLADWRDRGFRIVDTGGWMPDRAAGDELLALTRQVSAQAERAIREADVVVLVVDATVGVVEEDAQVARILQRAEAPVLVVANKVDGERQESDTWQFSRLGLGEPMPVSAVHGRGSGDVLDAIVAALPPAVETAPVEDDGIFAVAIVGRPNVGKSTLFNQIVGDERVVVHDEPGTTRDAIDTLIDTPDGPLRIVDTAGMRRRSRVDEGTEHFGVVRALEAADRADAALFVIDASAGVTHQDQRLAERIDAAGTAIVVVLNKWDLLDDDAERRRDVVIDIADRLSFLAYAPVLKISAKTGRGISRLLPALREAETAYHVRIPTAALNRVLQEAQASHAPPPAKRHRPRILYATQGASEPPTFTIFATHELPQTYLRYLERKLREGLNLGPTPMKLRVRRRSA
ncbi:MAG: ribosome biogenesis GTPase Der [Actinobacteria bacterium]|nr:ribosome biogenesis GTPase Der [Actinomycetota bacterium]